MLRIKALGSLAVIGDAGPIGGAAAQPRRLAVLALLARAGERGMTRDKIVSLLWPDADEERARTTLSKALYSVRRDLASEDVVVGSKDLRLNPDAITSDVAEFDRALAEGQYEKAASLYEGPFVDGFRLPGLAEFERWVESERASLEHAYKGILEKLAKRTADAGDFTAAVGWWRTLAAHDPLNARHALGFMRALDAAGDRAGAIQHGRIYEMLIQQELDLPPDRDVVAFARRLRDDTSLPHSVHGDHAKGSVVATPLGPVVTAPVSWHGTSAPAASPTAVAELQPAGVTAAPTRSGPRRSTTFAAGVAIAGLAVVAATLVTIRFRTHDAPGQKTPVIALGRITDYRENAPSELARPLTDMLATSLGRLDGARVVSPARMYELLTQTAGSDTSAAALVAAARRAGATELVDGALYTADSGRLRLDLRRVGLASGGILATHSVTGASLIHLADSGTARLAAKLGATLPAGSVGDVTTHSVAAYRLYEQGLRAYYQRDLRSAERFFEAALAEDSTFAMAAYYSAVSVGDRQRMLTRLARAGRLASRATDRERLTILAQLAYLSDERSLRAIAETLVIRYPAEVEGHFFSGIGLINGGEFLAAVPHLERVVAMDSLALTGERARCLACEAMRAIISAYQHADSLAAAERETRRWLRLQPRSPSAWHVLAEVLEQRGKSEAAIAALRREAELDAPSVVAAPTRAATHKIFRGDYEEAERLLHGQVDGVVSSQQAEAHWYLAVSYRQQARFDEALAHARRYRVMVGGGASRTTAPPSAVLEAQILFETGRFRQAAALFDSIPHGYSANEPRAYLARYAAWSMTHAADALAAAGDTTDLAARADSVRVLGSDVLFERDRRLHHHIRGLLLAARGRDVDAIAEFRQAIFSTSMGYTRTNLELARLYMRRREPREAIVILQPTLHGSLEASNLYVTRTELHELLAQAWEALGGPAARDSATAHWAEVVRAWRYANPSFVPRLRNAEARLRSLGHAG